VFKAGDVIFVPAGASHNATNVGEGHGEGAGDVGARKETRWLRP
jgi:mannose-6-phosphate isomerase-like protein (cupin superfamily)